MDNARKFILQAVQERKLAKKTFEGLVIAEGKDIPPNLDPFDQGILRLIAKYSKPISEKLLAQFKENKVKVRSGPKPLVFFTVEGSKEVFENLSVKEEVGEPRSLKTFNSPKCGSFWK